MTENSMTLTQYLDKIGVDLDGDFLREGARLMAQMAMDWEVHQKVGAGWHERSPQRTNQRNGYRERPWDTRVGSILLEVPKLRSGSYFPSILEPRRRAEKALLAVIQQAYIEGVSTRKVDDLLQSLGLTGIDKPALVAVRGAKSPGSARPSMRWWKSSVLGPWRGPIRTSGWTRCT